MPKKTGADSKSSADKSTLNPSQGSEQAASAPENSPARNQVQRSRTQGQFTAQGKPGLQKK